VKSKHLGKKTDYKLETYSPNFLDSVNRNSSTKIKPFFGHDFWNAYEFSYLNSQNQPVLESLEIKIPMTSLLTVESKSLKLYLASLFNKKFTDPKRAYRLIEKNLSQLTDSQVTVKKKISYQSPPQARLLNSAIKNIAKNKVIKFEGFRSICPVTSQPDWANIYFHSASHPIEPKPLIKLMESYRSKGDFHEACIESIFLSMLEDLKMDDLTVYGRFLRRGGIDINPLRSTNRKFIFSNFRDRTQ
jgi:7-cyano-7-deazaguanine reductase